MLWESSANSSATYVPSDWIPAYPSHIPTFVYDDGTSEVTGAIAKPLRGQCSGRIPRLQQDHNAVSFLPLKLSQQKKLGSWNHCCYCYGAYFLLLGTKFECVSGTELPPFIRIPRLVVFLSVNNWKGENVRYIPKASINIYLHTSSLL